VDLPKIKVGIFLVLGTDDSRLAYAAVNAFDLTSDEEIQTVSINGHDLEVTFAREAD
jgi:sortase (surface protein transpeptidase)